MRVTIDRFEGDFAVVERTDRTMADLPRTLVPNGAREGDVLLIQIDQAATRQQAQRIHKKMEGLWEE